MAFSFKKITPEQIAQKGVRALANRPNEAAQYGVGGLSPEKLKQHFDQLAVLIAEKYNEIAEALSDDNSLIQKICVKLYEGAPWNADRSTSLAMLGIYFKNGTFAEKIYLPRFAGDKIPNTVFPTAEYSLANIIADHAARISTGEETAETLTGEVNKRVTGEELANQLLSYATIEALKAAVSAITAESIGALEKVTSQGLGRVYAVNSVGDQMMRTYTGRSTAGNTLLFREADGSCRMQDPTDDFGIANRRTVDAAKADAVVFTSISSGGGEGSAEVATVRGDRTYLIRFDASASSGNIVTYVLHNGQIVANTVPYDYGGSSGYVFVSNNADGTVTVTGYASPSYYESVVCSVIPVRNFSQQTVTCFIEGTPVLLRNKDTGEVTEKNIEDVQAGDYLAFWSPAKGRLTQTRAVVPPVVGECDKYHRLSFSDGKTVDVFGNQFFWEIDRDQLINWTQLVPGESRVCTATGDIITYTGSEEVVPAAPVRHYTLMTFKGRYLAGGIQVGDKVELFYPRLTAPEYAEYWNGLTEGDRNYFKRAWAEGMHRRNWRFSREYEEATRELRAQCLATEKEIAERQRYLDSTDYQTAKLAEGLLTEEEYAPVRAQRQTARDAINTARNTLQVLKEELESAEQAVKAAVQSTLQKKYENAFAGKTRAEVEQKEK